MATTDERKALREALIERGFTRDDCTMDDGNGEYEETFVNGENVVTLHWGPKTEERREFFPERVKHGACIWCHVRHGLKHADDCRHAGKFVGDVVNPPYHVNRYGY